MTEAPRSAADPRPDGKPYYIEPNCSTCGTALVLLDVLEKSSGLVWHDEWVCPNHFGEGVHMDWPPEEFEKFRKVPKERGTVYTDVEDLIRDLELEP